MLLLYFALPSRCAAEAAGARVFKAPRDLLPVKKHMPFGDFLIDTHMIIS